MQQLTKAITGNPFLARERRTDRRVMWPRCKLSAVGSNPQ